MRVPPYELGCDRLDGVRDREVALLVRDLREEHDLEQQVAELLAQLGGVAAVDRLERLVRLFEQERAQRLQRLLTIPRAPAGGPERAHDVHELSEAFAGRVHGLSAGVG